jgi:hypothetical protein
MTPKQPFFLDAVEETQFWVMGYFEISHDS